mmetsp:Transcript_3673/g.11577  ORF Transcript_3673/g.11577 Transcript_3673/m.11577 type:complete len:86 (+) Transcript_3673:3270-3527(+)
MSAALPWNWEEVLADEPPPLPPIPTACLDTPQRAIEQPRGSSPAAKSRQLQALAVEELQARNRLKVEASAGSLLLMRKFAGELRA